MAPKKPKATCLRCPEVQLEIANHGNNLTKCQKEFKDDESLYGIVAETEKNEHSVLWPNFPFDGLTRNFQDKDDAQVHIDNVRVSVANGGGKNWSKAAMEEAAKLAYPDSDAKKQKKTAKDSDSTARAPPDPRASKRDPRSGLSSPDPFAPGPSRPDPVPSTPSAPGPAGPPPAGPTPAGPTATTLAGPTNTGATSTGTNPSTAPVAPVAPVAPAQPAAMAPLANPQGPNFMTTQVQHTVETVALQEVNQLAGRLADNRHDTQQCRAQVPAANRTRLTDQERENIKPDLIRKFGLRTAFTTSSQVMIETNFLNMTFPRRIYVYDIDMIRVINNGTPIRVKKQWDKVAVIRRLMDPQAQFGQYSAALRNNGLFWVSDGSMIWSTVGLFNANNAASVPGPIGPALPNPIQYENECGDQLPIHQVDITYRCDIDLTRSVGQLFYDATAPTLNDSVPGILTRGLNAFFTRYVSDRNLNFTCVGSNRSFETSAAAPGRSLDVQHPHILRAIPGFFLSVRPGVQTMYINVSPATSPFFDNGLTVQTFIDRCTVAPQFRNIDEVCNYLKGVKVRINYNTNNNTQTFRHANSRFSFIKGIGRTVALETQMNPAYPAVANVAAWYLPTSQYGGNFEFPNPVLPLTGREYAVNVGTDPATNINRVEWYPANALDIVPWQPFRGRLVSGQTTEMINQALQRPQDHRNNVISANAGGALHHFAFGGGPAQPTQGIPGSIQGGLGHVGMTAGTQLIQVPGRFLDPPIVRYSNERQPDNTQSDREKAGKIRPARIIKAAWNLQNCGFVEPHAITDLPVLNISGSALPQDFQQLLRTQLRKHGLLANMGVPVRVSTANMPQGRQHKLSPLWEQTFSNALNNVVPRGNPTRPTVLVVMREKDYDDYACIKRVGDLIEGVHTICVTKKTVSRDRGIEQTFSNIALKYNIKVGGDNHRLGGDTLNNLKTNNRANTIVIGADVTHPNNGSHTATPSIAAVVGSVDDNFMKYPGSMRLQPSKKEDIVDLADMVKERLLEWARNHGQKLPQNVLFYRDGVSESQYDILRRRELPQIQTAMNSAYRILDRQAPPGRPPHAPTPPAAITTNPPLSPEAQARLEKDQEEAMAEQIESTPHNIPMNLTFIVVGKRHNTRFYPTQKAQWIDSQGFNANANVNPGLVVDQVITHPYSMDFYLQSHKPIKGTGRSAHYFVLRNNMALTADSLQKITNTLCFAYARSTTAVSYCAPAYYADRLCDRGRAYLRRLLVKNPSWNARLPQKTQNQTWQQYLNIIKTIVYNDPEYRNHQIPQNHNPWRGRVGDNMFYL